MDEFELIRRFFDREVTSSAVVTGVGDDGAVLSVDPEREQIQVIDTLVEGVHFPPESDPYDIGFRAVAVNLSDIAAMGGRPLWMTLALTLPPKDESWLAAFAEGLFAAAGEFDVALIGGDTTSGNAVVTTVHMTGDVAPGQALLRSGARVGDTIYVTGTVGDAAAGLELIQRGERDDVLAMRFRRPAARVEAGQALIGHATAAIDISDGLIGDLRKLLDASGVGADVDVARVPMSRALKSRFSMDAARRFALTGGDDYELCITAADDKLDVVADLTAIGTVTEGHELVCRLDGTVVDVDDRGYRHFQNE